MNLSEDDSNSDDNSIPAKRTRLDTYGASSTTSHGSVLQESDEDSPTTSYVDNYAPDNLRPNKVHFNYGEDVSKGLYRQSRSSLSENCSSPNEPSDDYRPAYREKDNDEETENITGFQASNDSVFYNRTSDNASQSDHNAGQYSEFSKRIMSNMGYKPGKGLGKFEHGRVEPVEASTQKGRRGLGAKPSAVGEIPKDLKWNQDQSTPQAVEKVFSLPVNDEDPLTDTTLGEWLRQGPKKLTIDDETDFVDPQILKGVINAKSIFDNLQDEDMRKARFRSNPYETIGSVIFLNRAAVKMANIDALFDYMFTLPKNRKGEPIVGQKDLLYFADVCAGPGGFSEYVLYRKGWRAKGFGFTLKGSNDFKLKDFHAGTAETFTPYYGVENDGNIFNPANLMSLKDYVLKQTDDLGVHFLMADGGFSVEGQENIQEILSKQLYLCQCLAALMLVRTGGNFVVKLFDVFTRFSVGLIYLMYHCFVKVCIHKPVTSRPANSERYLICFWKKPGVDMVEKHLFSVNSMMWNNHGEDDDIMELVPQSVLQEDKVFFDYIYASNCRIGEYQIKNLLKIAQYSKDESLKEENQASMKTQCLELWNLPNKVRMKPENCNPDGTLTFIYNTIDNPNVRKLDELTFKTTILNKPPHYLEAKSDVNIFMNVYDWHFTFLSSNKDSSDLKLFMGCGGKKVYQLDGTTWTNVAHLHVILPAKTLIYAEVVKEFRGEGSVQMHSKALHIIDAMFLGGIDISNEPLNARVLQCELFCKALEKQNENSQLLPIRYKRFFNMESFQNTITNLEYRAMKRIKKALTINIPRRSTKDDVFYIVGSVLFIKEVKDPWIAQISKKSGAKYYFCIGPDKKPQSLYTIPEGGSLDMPSAYGSRVMWPWGDAAQAIFDGKTKSCVSRLDMEEHIKRKL